MSILNVSQLSRQEDGRLVLSDINFEQKPLQNIALAGATGSGKTTLLKIIAGLMEPSAGAVYFNGDRILGPTEKLLPGHPAIAYLSQHFELRNHYRVSEILDMAKKVPDDEASLIYEVCRIHHLLHRWTHQLSGGEKQRIALARLLITTPQLLLLDEPYSNLDPFHKNILKAVIADVSGQLDTTCILVSHDPMDTLSWADEILVLGNGQLLQQGTPRQVYSKPVNEYAAGLFGKYAVLTTSLAKAFAPYTDIRLDDLGRFIRPEEFKLVNAETGVKARVKQVNFLGSFFEVSLQIADVEIVLTTSDKTIHAGQTVHVSL